MKKVIFAIAIVALLAAWAALATAQPARPYVITAGIGYANLSDLTLTAENGVESDNPTPDGSIAVGAGVFYRAMPEMALGVEVAWLNFGTQTIDGADDTYYAIPVTGQGLYTIPTSSAATPFLTGGAGIYHLRNKVEGISETATKNVFGFNAGGGVKIESDSNVGFGVDVRFHMALNPELTFAQTFETSNWKMLTVMAKLFF